MCIYMYMCIYVQTYTHIYAYILLHLLNNRHVYRSIDIQIYININSIAENRYI